MRRDNRCAVCHHQRGTRAGSNQTVTYKGTCEILDDDETKAWFYPALAEALNPADEQWQRKLLLDSRLTSARNFQDYTHATNRLRWEKNGRSDCSMGS